MNLINWIFYKTPSFHIIISFLTVCLIIIEEISVNHDTRDRIIACVMCGSYSILIIIICIIMRGRHHPRDSNSGEKKVHHDASILLWVPNRKSGKEDLHKQKLAFWVININFCQTISSIHPLTFCSPHGLNLHSSLPSYLDPFAPVIFFVTWILGQLPSHLGSATYSLSMQLSRQDSLRERFFLF